MASEQDKSRQQERVKRQMVHWLRDEQQRQRKKSKTPRAANPQPRQRNRVWSEEDETFEKMPRRTDSTPPRAHSSTVPELPADHARAVVMAVHRGRVDLDVGASARLAGRLCLDRDFQLAVGDEVAITETDGPPRIEALLPRRSWIGRPDPGNQHRDLVLAANVDVAVITAAAADPPPRPGLIDRFLLAVSRGRVAPALCINKVDLLTDADALAHLIDPYLQLGVPVFPCSAAEQTGIAALRAYLAGKACVFVGHSGVGKSSLLNALDPDGERIVGAVRSHDGKGRHTTSAAHLRRLADGTAIIDTPGIRELGMERFTRTELLDGFPEFAAAGGCRFADCAHDHEPDCAVRQAALANARLAARHASYLRILHSLGEPQ